MARSKCPQSEYKDDRHVVRMMARQVDTTLPYYYLEVCAVCGILFITRWDGRRTTEMEVRFVPSSSS